ncbi:hypothetical protein JCM11641_004405 [Rhodosporidiobolus odoratus]
MIRNAWLYALQNTQSVVTCLTFYFVLRIRTAHSCYFGLGTLVATFSAKILKRCIRQPRPVSAKKYQKTYGMPSTHSSTMAFFGTYLSLSSLLLPFHPRVTTLLPFYNRATTLALASSLGPGATQTSFWRHFAGALGQRATRVGLAVFFLGGAASVCWSRVRLGHHTRAQVIAGASLGTTIALVWMSLWLGTDGLSTLTGRDLHHVLLHSSNGTQVPHWVVGGLGETLQVWERMAEDACYLGLEVWKEGSWDELRELGGALWAGRGALAGEL